MRCAAARIWSVVVGVVFLLLGLAFQLFFLFLLTGALLLGLPEFFLGRPLVDSNAAFWLVTLVLAGIINGATCALYFTHGQVKKAASIADSDAGHVLTVLFFLPRALDRIFAGRERL